ERRAGERDLLGLEARRRDVALQRRELALVVPPDDVRAVGAGCLGVGRALQHDLAPGVVLDVRPGLAELRRQPRLPDVGWLDEVRVEVDDGRDLRQHLGRDVGISELHHGSSNLYPSPSRECDRLYRPPPATRALNVTRPWSMTTSPFWVSVRKIAS